MSGSMSKMGGRGWRLRTGYMGSGAVVFPDTDKAALAFLKAIDRPLTDADEEGWLAYADRIGMAPDAAERAWKSLTKAELLPAVSEALDTLRLVFEATSWWGYSVPHPLQVKTRQGPPTPPMVEPPVSQGGPGVRTAAPPSFPFHTKVSGDIYSKALKLIRVYPLELPGAILQRAVRAAGVTPRVDITPEDEHLLKMAIEFAQNGPAKSKGNRIGGAPGGPFNSTSYPGKKGAP